MINKKVISYIIKSHSNLKQKLQETRSQLEETSLLLEQRLREADRVNLSRIMTAGIAHDFRNLLSGIIGNAQLLERNFSEEQTRENQRVGAILLSARRSADLINSFSNFSSKKEQKHNVKIDKILSNIFTIMESKLKQVTFKYSNKNKDLKITVSGNNIGQVLYNIILNALDALDGKFLKKIKVNVKTVKLSSKNNLNLKAGKYAKIRITNNGPMIPKKILNKIFEEYFTTKPEGKGTGLGLAVSKVIINNHNGQITCESNLRRTRFTVYLPISKKTD